MISNRDLRSIFAIAFLLLTGTNAIAANSDMGLPTIKNFATPEPNRYRAGQPTNEEFRALAKKGIEHVINLRPPQETPNINEAAQVTLAGMAYYNIPISNADDLTFENVKAIDNILSKINDEKVLVHCASSNRVGAIMALRAAWIYKESPNSAIKIGKNWGLTRLQAAVEEQLTQ